ncbi:helix-turn-helix domain-containing protein [Actinoplanes couchii]|uniref:helix-turn-helix domain-containing protein n=1 Tax=Actinoplanes couchii TaxID=403638 RepID=UPI001EF30CB0|nr:helix-turn-helix domain-containing protein [Actinoplanes couchii]MDR6320612.1 methylphosphotriester-DNA--protein-cysteine methyltransferase [Actinoplanes couchii]
MWEVIRPGRASRLPGVGMAGFRDRGVITTGQRAIPHPAVTLALEFGGGSLVVTDASGRQRRDGFVAGVGFGSGAFWVRGERFQAVQVRLSPLVASGFLGVPPGDLDDGVVNLGDVWGRSAARLADRLHHAGSWDERFALVEAALARRWRSGPGRSGPGRSGPGPTADPEVARVWRRIRDGHGRGRIDGLAAEVGWSRKRLWSRFSAQLGVLPKHAARLIRFDHAVHRLVAGEPAARVAADSGYADQSHLNRDVVAFAGSAPGAAAREPWLAVDKKAWPPTK